METLVSGHSQAGRSFNCLPSKAVSSSSLQYHTHTCVCLCVRACVGVCMPVCTRNALTRLTPFGFIHLYYIFLPPLRHARSLVLLGPSSICWKPGCLTLLYGDSLDPSDKALCSLLCGSWGLSDTIFLALVLSLDWWFSPEDKGRLFLLGLLLSGDLSSGTGVQIPWEVLGMERGSTVLSCRRSP